MKAADVETDNEPDQTCGSDEETWADREQTNRHEGEPQNTYFQLTNKIYAKETIK